LLLLVCEGSDDLAKGKETFVDINRFFVSLVSREGLSLTTSQVNHLKLASDYIVWVFGIYLFNSQTKHGMGTRGLVIHTV
jgi:hypothetical protein